MLEPQFLGYLDGPSNGLEEKAFREWMTAERMLGPQRPQHFLLVEVNQVGMVERQLAKDLFRSRKSVYRAA
ncbi:hypothetical protein D9M71_755010 [compost metagenome]